MTFDLTTLILLVGWIWIGATFLYFFYRFYLYFKGRITLDELSYGNPDSRYSKVIPFLNKVFGILGFIVITIVVYLKLFGDVANDSLLVLMFALAVIGAFSVERNLQKRLEALGLD